MSSANQITFQYQMIKVYEFDHLLHVPVLGMTIQAAQLEQLATDGLVQNYFIQGTSAPITIPYVA